MKPVKAIDLVRKAQPMISTLRTVMASLAADKAGKSAPGVLVENCDDWLRDADDLLSKRRCG